jgi:hypothetical protein
MARGTAMTGLPVEKLRRFLRQLPPASRTLLISELERTLLRGEEIPGGDFLLHEVRSAIRESGEQAPRIDNVERMFFRPVEPFLLDETSTQKIQGRIARGSLEPIWAWICRDLVPTEAATFADAVSSALIANDTARSERLAAEFQDRVAERCQLALAAAASDDKARRRLAGQVGTTRTLDDVRDLAAILRHREGLAQIGERLPGHIRNLADGALDAAKSALDSQRGRADGLLPYALIAVMSRLAAPWQLIRLAIKAAQSDDAVRIAATPYAAAVILALADMERMVGELKADLKRGGNVAVTSLLKSIHDAARGVRTELDLPVDSAWARQLVAIRAEISSMLKAQVESAPSRVRRLLRPRPASEIEPHSVIEPDDIAEVESLIELVGACRTYASELAISEMTTRAWSELQHYLDTGTQSLLDGLRAAGAADRRFRQSQVDAAVRFCGKVFGREYASLLSKAAEVAAQSERKAAARA